MPIPWGSSPHHGFQDRFAGRCGTFHVCTGLPPPVLLALYTLLARALPGPLSQPRHHAESGAIEAHGRVSRALVSSEARVPARFALQAWGAGRGTGLRAHTRRGLPFQQSGLEPSSVTICPLVSKAGLEPAHPAV